MKNLKQEMIAGFTTFLTSAYIVVVNPSILAVTGMPVSGLVTATVLLCVSMTLLMGIYAKLPFVVAPGMGINAYFAYSLVVGKQIPWRVALGLVFWSGILFLLLSVVPVRERITRAIPQSLRHAAAVGIGLFLSFIGLKNAGMVVADPVTLVRLGQVEPTVGLALLGLLTIIVLIRRKSPFAFLIGIGLVTLLSMALGYTRMPEKLMSLPDFSSVFFQLDIVSALRLSFLPAIVGICFTDLFDSLSTFVGVSQATGLLDKNGQPKNLKQGLIVDAFATLGAGLMGTSSGTAFIESSAGIETGGRTGFTAVFCALCFLPCFFIAPLISIVPPYATAPALIVVGASLFRSASQIVTSRWEDFMPAFLTLILIPLTFSITSGILWGFLTHVCAYTLAGRGRELDPALVVISGFCLLLLATQNLHLV